MTRHNDTQQILETTLKIEVSYPIHVSDMYISTFEVFVLPRLFSFGSCSLPQISGINGLVIVVVVLPRLVHI